MELLYTVIVWALLVIGIAGCFIPVLPGPPISYAALVFTYFVDLHHGLSLRSLALTGVATALVTVLDYVVPAIGAHKFKCSRAGTIGCFIGTIIGLFFLPFGVVAGPFFGALIGETSSGKRLAPALLGAVGALLGYLFGIVLKLICCAFIVVVYWNATH